VEAYTAENARNLKQKKKIAQKNRATLANVTLAAAI
jgi:hypothetical protein